MFRRVALALPAEPPRVAAGAPRLLVREDNNVRFTNESEDKTGVMYEFHISNNERANELYKEHVHQQIREEVHKQLAAEDLHQLFVNDKAVTEQKWTDKPSINIMTSGESKLSTCDNVIIVVGEHDKDLGIYDWVDMKTSRGINTASVLGLIHLLPTHKDPGVIVLNPGQLLWSHALQTNMTKDTWVNRRKPENVDQSSYEIHPIYNRVPGHTNSEEHVNTFLDHILPQLTKEHVRLHFIAIGDGGDTLIKWLDNKLTINSDDPITERVAAMALIEPTLRDTDIKSSYMRNFCHNSYKVYSWVLSEKPTSTLVGLPEVLSFREYVTDPINDDYHNSQVMAENPVFVKYDKYNITSGLKAVLATKEAFNLNVTGDFEEYYSDVFCGTFSGGESQFVSKILPVVLPGILRWFDNSRTTEQKVRDFVSAEPPALPQAI